MPAEIHTLIFFYLDADDKGHEAQLCRAWRDIALYVPIL